MLCSNERRKSESMPCASDSRLTMLMANSGAELSKDRSARGPCGSDGVGSPARSQAFSEPRLRCVERCERGFVGLRKVEVELREGVVHELRNLPAQVVLVVGRDRVPRRPRPRRRVQALPRKPRCNRPSSRARRDRRRLNFQFFSGSSMRSRSRARCSVLRHVEPKLQDHGALLREMALVLDDRAEALLPESLAATLLRQLLRRERYSGCTRTTSTSS